nr:LytTR family DNA-binding domain-containing protein [uncultured Psychroserpens sp.]
MINVLVIEDEKASSDYLVTLFGKSTLDIKVQSIITSVYDSIAWLNANDCPDLIFMDVQLSDGKSFEIFNNFKVKSPVVFVTAYDDYAIKAFKTTGIDYLLKPIKDIDLNRALNKYYENKLLLYQNNKSMSLQATNTGIKDRFLVREGNHYIPIKLDDIAYFYWSDYAFIKKFDGKSYLINHSLSQLEEMIAPHLFIRINRQIIVNVNAIESLMKKENTYVVNLIPKFSEDVSISKESYTNLKKRLS